MVEAGEPYRRPFVRVQRQRPEATSGDASAVVKARPGVAELGEGGAEGLNNS